MMRDEFVSRWGDTELDDRQYLTTPGWILRNYHKFVDIQTGERVGLTPQEFTVMSHIMAFRYDTPEGEARPSLKTIAEYMGVSLSAVRRAKNRMELKGALRVEYKKGAPSVYSFTELARQCRKYEAGNASTNEIATPSKFASTTKNEGSTPSKNEGGVPPNLQGEESGKDQQSKKEGKSADKPRARTSPDAFRKEQVLKHPLWQAYASTYFAPPSFTQRNAKTHLEVIEALSEAGVKPEQLTAYMNKFDEGRKPAFVWLAERIPQIIAGRGGSKEQDELSRVMQNMVIIGRDA